MKQLQRCEHPTAGEFPNQRMETKLWDQGPSCQQRGLPVAAKGSYDFCWLLRNGVFLGSSKQKKLGLVDQHVINTKKHLKTPMGDGVYFDQKHQTHPRLQSPWEIQEIHGRVKELVGDFSISRRMQPRSQRLESWCPSIYQKVELKIHFKLNLVEQIYRSCNEVHGYFWWMEVVFFFFRFVCLFR